MVTHSSILAWRIPMDRGSWRATVHGVAKSRTRLSRTRLSTVNAKSHQDLVLGWLKTLFRFFHEMI